MGTLGIIAGFVFVGCIALLVHWASRMDAMIGIRRLSDADLDYEISASERQAERWISLGAGASDSAKRYWWEAMDRTNKLIAERRRRAALAAAEAAS